MRSKLEIRVLSRKDAELALREDRSLGNIQALISIADAYPYTKKAPYGTAKVPNVLRLLFDDTTFCSPHFAPPQIEQIKQITEFAKALEGLSGTLVIHCEAGISRSAAAGVICKTVWLGPEYESEAILDIYRNNRKAWPNTLMIQYADELLGRNGNLIAAVRDNPDAELWWDAQNFNKINEESK